VFLNDKTYFVKKFINTIKKEELKIIEIKRKVINYILVASKYKIFLFKAKGYQGAWDYYLGYYPPRDGREWRKMSAPPPETKFILVVYPDGKEEIVASRYGQIYARCTINENILRKLEEDYV
jgi:hypothetical protein